MSEIEIKQMQEKIDAGILLAQKRLIEKTKKEDGELVVVRDGKVVRIKARDLKSKFWVGCPNESSPAFSDVGDSLFNFDWVGGRRVEHRWNTRNRNNSR